MSGCTHVIFDLDGTLLDTEALYSDAAAIVCARHGARYTPAIKRMIMGGDTRRGAEIVVRELSLPIAPEQYMREREIELARLMPFVQAMPHAAQLVHALRQRAVPMAIATSAHAAITALKLTGHPFLHGLGPLVCGDDPRLRQAKPAPDIFLVAAQELGVTPERCVVVEDTVNGVRAARAAGMRAVAVIDPRFGFTPADFSEASAIVGSLAELSDAPLGLSAG